MADINLVALSEEEKKRREKLKSSGKAPVKLVGAGKKISIEATDKDKKKKGVVTKKKPPRKKGKGLQAALDLYKKEFPEDFKALEEGKDIPPEKGTSFLTLARLNRQRKRIKEALETGDWKEESGKTRPKEGWNQLKRKKSLERRLKHIEDQIVKFGDEEK